MVDAQVGVGGRSMMYSHAPMGDFAQCGELVAICDINAGRLAYPNEHFAEKYGAAPVPAYGSADFGKMIRENAVDTDIVTPMDRTHHRYIAEAMDADKCAVMRDILIGTDADHVAGTDSIMVGIAANRSLATGLPVRIADLVSW